MSKLLKHLGIGGKKTPPHPPKPDYGLKSTSVQDLLSRNQSNDRYGDGTSTISVCESDENSTDSTRSVDRRVKDKDKDKFSLPRQNSRSERYSVNVSDDFRGRLDVVVDDDIVARANRTPPGLLADYSDPCDVKKQIIQHTTDLLSVSVNTDMAQQSDDDYSVPYDVKRKMQSNLAQSVAANPASAAKPVGNAAANPSVPPYEEAWEWSSPSQQVAAANGPPNNGTVPAAVPGGTSVGKYVNVNGVISNRDASNVMPEPSLATASLVANDNSNSMQNEKNNAETTADSQVQLDTSNQSCATETSVATAVNKALASGLTSSDGPMSILVSKPSNIGRQAQQGNYEEPWDLMNMQEKLEEKLRLAAAAKGIVSAVPPLANQSDVSTTVAAPSSVQIAPAAAAAPSAALASSSALPVGGATAAAGATMAPPDARSMEGYDKPWDWKPHKKDDRAQEGYDKPWDWKPHKKDDRAQEGYDKPWDWKPHQKDTRPATEYDQPWDQRAKGIEKELMKAKGPSAGGGASVAPPPSAARGKKESDARPTEEYDSPWDQRAKKLQNKLTAGDGASSSAAESPAKLPSASVPSTSLSPVLHPRPSPSYGGAMLSPATERIDVTRPLEQQGWYHGSISRTDAEALLRPHPEGSFLVRQSESNKLDLSLSLKSMRGYMHMKIVSRDGKFILGQFSQPFENIPLMIHHYSRNKLPIKGAEHINLTRPVVNDML